VRRFEGTMQGLPASAVEKFYRCNFEGLMGAALAGI
jgi:hypothetical protein